MHRPCHHKPRHEGHLPRPRLAKTPQPFGQLEDAIDPIRSMRLHRQRFQPARLRSDDKWDEELEEGDTILAVQMDEELVIRTMHHANDLAAAANAEKPRRTFEEMVPEEYQSFRDLFSKENFNEMPERTPWDHAIELIPNAKATLDCKVYPLNRNEQEQLDKFLDENLVSGHIRPSKSPYASPFFFIKKKDGTLRPVQDYRKLNEMTIKNCYPLPLISELIDKL